MSSTAAAPKQRGNAAALAKGRAVLAEKRAAGVKIGDSYSVGSIARYVALGIYVALNADDQTRRYPPNLKPPKGVSHNAVNFWLKLRKNNPAKFAELVAKLLGKLDPSKDDGELRIVVQQLNVIAGPVAGVLNSPIAAHIAPQRPLPEVIELQGADDA